MLILRISGTALKPLIDSASLFDCSVAGNFVVQSSAADPVERSSRRSPLGTSFDQLIDLLHKQIG